MEKYENFMRKLHSFAGIIPLGVFLTFHLCANFTAIWGEDSYNGFAGFMASIPPFILFLLETFVIFLPLLFHGIYGVVIALQAKNNVGTYKYARNWFFFFQRITGIIAFLFVIWHVWQTRAQVIIGAAEHADFNMMANIVENPIALILYMIGIASATYHLANGLFTFLISWGITITPKSQKIFKIISIACFVLITFVGLRAILAFA